MFNSIKTFAKNTAAKVKSAFAAAEAVASSKAHEVLDGTVAEAYVDTGVKILIAVVIGALLLGGLYALFGDVILPTLETEIEGMFDFAG